MIEFLFIFLIIFIFVYIFISALSINNNPRNVAIFSFRIHRKKLKELDALKEELGLRKGMDLFNNALSLMKWAIKESKKGRKIGSYDAKSDTFGQVALPALEALRKKAHSKQNDTL